MVMYDMLTSFEAGFM